MRILHIVASMSPQWGGPVTAVKGLTEALARKNIDVTIFTPVKRGEDNKVVSPSGVEMRLFHQDFLSKIWRNHSFDLERGLKQAIESFDLIHIHELWHHAHFFAYHLARKFKKPYIISVHGGLSRWALNHKALKKRIYAKLIQKTILREASLIHAITSKEVNEISAFGINNTPVVILPNGLNIEEFENLPQKKEFFSFYPQLKNKKIFIFLGRIHPKKGLDILAKAFGKVAKTREDLFLLIVGPDEGGYQRKIEELLKYEGVINRVIFTGMLTGYEKLVALRGADYFVLPSYSEGFSMSILEAMICSLPVIITIECNFNGVAEHNAGLVIKPDVDDLVKAMIYLIEKGEETRKMGENGKNLVLERYTWDKIAEEMIKVYSFIRQNRRV